MSDPHLSPDAVTRVLRARFDVTAECVHLVRGPVGNGQETWFVDVATATGDRRLVLRRTAPGGPLVWTDRRREFETLRTVAAAGLPVPVAHWVEDSGSVLERPYLVMDRAPGVPATHAPEEDQERVATELARHLARLHAAPSLLSPPNAAMSSGEATANELRHWRQIYQRNRPAPVPMLGALLSWLVAHRPVSDRPAVLLWGDPGPHNLLVDNGAITTMLDWELAHPGDPAEDLGTALWFYGDRIDPEAMLGAYEADTGVEIDRAVIGYFVAMACVTRSVMVLSGAASFARGETSEPNTAALGIDLLQQNLGRAATLAGWEGSPGDALAAAAEPVAIHPAQSEVSRGLAGFLRTDVLPRIDDRRVRRGVKAAAALLDANALRAGHEAEVVRRRRAAVDTLLTDMNKTHSGTVANDLESLAIAAEEDADLAAWQAPLRRLLLADLAAQRDLVRPLRRLYG